MRCSRCGNGNKELFMRRGGVWVCRVCLSYKFDREQTYFHGDGEYKLDYDLTNDQLKASEFLLSSLKEGKDATLKAVTCAGKTEIIYDCIKYCVKNNLKVAVAIPRKDVVIELFKRIEKDFKSSSVVSVYGGHAKELNSDIVILTTHQLYRYNNYFDLIIIDEVDAFPYRGNLLLQRFLHNASKGNVFYMSATIPKGLNTEHTYYLNKRYHGEKLDIPKIRYMFFNWEIERFIKRHKNDLVLIYFPTIKEQIKFSKKFKHDFFLINSKVSDRNNLLYRFHKLEKGIILTTLVLERGITFRNCHVIVFKADSSLFGYENLVQISGRVGRKKDYPHGEILFLVNHKSRNVRRTIKELKRANE